MDATLAKGLKVLEALADSDQPQSVTALSQRLGLPKSNIHRTLATLVETGYAQRHGELRRYSATLKTWEVGANVISRNFLRRASLPFLRVLHQETRETVYLAVLDGTDVLYLEKIDALYPLVKSIRIGQRIPSIFPASGLAILAHLPDAEPRVRRCAEASRPIRPIDPDAVLALLAEVRSKGYAQTLNGWNQGAVSIAVPILGPGSIAMGSVGIAGPIERLSEELGAKFLAMVRNSALQIAELIGSDSL